MTKPELICKLEQGDVPWELPGGSLSGEEKEEGGDEQGLVPLNVSGAQSVECLPSRSRAPALIPSTA